MSEFSNEDMYNVLDRAKNGLFLGHLRELSTSEVYASKNAYYSGYLKGIVNLNISAANTLLIDFSGVNLTDNLLTEKGENKLGLLKNILG